MTDVTFDLAEKVAALTAENARLRDDLRMAGDRVAVAESGKRVLAANVVALHDTVADLRAENARLRGEVSEQTSEARSLRERLKDAYADLARVSGERDGLLAAANTVILGYDTDKDNMLDHYVDSLRLAIAACVPPASGLPPLKP